MKHQLLESVSGNENSNFVYLLKANFDLEFYSKRTNRNIGWISTEEQEIIKNSTVSIAGCGGMGGNLASILLRLGVGKLKIADPEVFDESNINRQFGASKTTIGKSKALVTAKMLREISEDTEITVYPMGINESIVEDFVDGSDLICDEIEFWALGARLILHNESRKYNIPILSANTVGHQANLFYFDPKAESLEKLIGISIEEANKMQNLVQAKKLEEINVSDFAKSITSLLIPFPPDYGYIDDQKKLIKENVIKRLHNEASASIIATNPSFACGFLANHVLFQLLKKSKAKRSVVLPPKFPGYLSIDCGTMELKINF